MILQLSFPEQKGASYLSDNDTLIDYQVNFADVWEHWVKSEVDYTCKKCKKMLKASKQTKIVEWPQILIISFKRFRYCFKAQRSLKINTPIEFPEDFKISIDDAKYEIYCFINHIGGTSLGHYIAHWRQPETKEWYRFNDSLCSVVLEERAVNQLQHSYVIFCRRIWE